MPETAVVMEEQAMEWIQGSPENLEQLKAIKDKVDAWVGISSKAIQWSGDPAHHIDLHYKSPTGVLLFTLGIHWYRGVWHFASRSVGLPLDVDHLRKMIEPLQPTEEQLLDAVFQKA